MTKTDARPTGAIGALGIALVCATMGPATAQSVGTGGANGQIPYYWESRPATSAAVVNGLQRAELDCSDNVTALTTGGSIMCTLSGRDGEDMEASVDPTEAGSDRIPDARVPTFAETVESILTGPR